MSNSRKMQRAIREARRIHDMPTVSLDRLKERHPLEVGDILRTADGRHVEIVEDPRSYWEPDENTLVLVWDIRVRMTRKRGK